MRFRLFSTNQLSFKVTDPVALIESYCFQSYFYANYDLIPLDKRKVEHVNKLGARIGKNLLSRCKDVTEKTRNLKIFDYDLDKFLDLDVEKRNDYIKEFNEKALKKLCTKGIGLSKATKILHTLYPKIIPIIDNSLKDEYKKINRQWRDKKPEIFIAYYDNLKENDNWQNLNTLYEKVKEYMLCLTKVRIFDILWWSFLKAKKLKEKEGVNWSTIEW